MKMIIAKNIFPQGFKLWGLSFLMTSFSLGAQSKVEVRPLGNLSQSAITSQHFKTSAALRKLVEKEGFEVLSERFSVLDQRIEMELFNYKKNEARSYRAPAQNPQQAELVLLNHAPMVTEIEFQKAFQIVSRSTEFSQALKNQDIELYEAMPGILERAQTEALKLGRSVTVGLRPLRKDRPHEIVAVDLRDQKIHRFSSRAPESCRETTNQFCGYRPGQGPLSRRGAEGTAEVIIRDTEGAEAWRFVVTRPANSSGPNGSGMDLQNVSYRGQKILTQFHLPLQNVLYDKNACGPYRDWQHTENAFQAQGDLLAPGILQASERPQSIVDAKNDSGNFVGIAIYTDPKTQVTRLVSEMSAGWYRYVQEFFFHLDGTFEPRWTFTAVQSSCVCKAHRHHIYARMDFAVITETENQLQVLQSNSKDSLWESVKHEGKFFRTPGQRWRVINPSAKLAVEIYPGPNDETAMGDSYAKGDLWALAFQANEIEDSTVRRDTSSYLDLFVGPELIENQNFVLWYGHHYRHDSEHSEEESRSVGPTLKVVSLPSKSDE
jgi:hypothetical protein